MFSVPNKIGRKERHKSFCLGYLRDEAEVNAEQVKKGARGKCAGKSPLPAAIKACALPGRIGGSSSLPMDLF